MEITDDGEVIAIGYNYPITYIDNRVMTSSEKIITSEEVTGKQVAAAGGWIQPWSGLSWKRPGPESRRSDQGPDPSHLSA